MPEMSCPSADLMTFITESWHSSKMIDIFNDMTEEVWACGKDVKDVLVMMAGRYPMTRNEVIELKNTFDLIDVVHEQECEDNMERIARQRNHHELGLLYSRLEDWKKAKEIFRVNPNDAFIEKLIRDGGGDYLGIMEAGDFIEQADMEITEINGFIDEYKEKLVI